MVIFFTNIAFTLYYVSYVVNWLRAKLFRIFVNLYLNFVSTILPKGLDKGLIQSVRILIILVKANCLPLINRKYKGPDSPLNSILFSKTLLVFV